MRRSLFFPVGLLALVLSGCGGSGDCLEALDLACAPLYEPTFAELHARTLSGSCAVGGCHSGTSRAAGISLEGIDEAYAALTGEAGGPRAIAGDAACSLLVRRVESSEASFVMPPGRPLSTAERCVIRRWVANGAQR
ncbi:MAG: hypothetical protein IT384_00695 [Deltaproteobacteria bacterium]|nr:hypothetical protein [Deltaproteobacteria bacterium]